MDYGQISDAAQMSQRPVNHEALCEQQLRQNERSFRISVSDSQKGAATAQTELSSLLTTLTQQAHELRGIAASILSRVAPLSEEKGTDEEGFSSGYIGQVERVRSIQRETINTLLQLAKLA